ncbi:MAG: leucine-rich repeat protein, partial [Clostridia bacterium]|nr:leucine-rich repeat protein [Clostridia bacterium]
MKNIWKRTLAMLLVVVMVGGAAPLGALADMDWPTLPEGAASSWWNDGVRTVKSAAKWLGRKLQGLSLRASAETVSGSCGAGGADVTWSLDLGTGELTISGSGAMSTFYPSPWNSYLSFIRSVTIRNGVTSIGDSAFYECTRLIGVTIPNSVTTIYEDAFNGCTELTSVTIPNSVTQIGDYAFKSCNALKEITIPENVEKIGRNAFGDCLFLSKIEFNAFDCKLDRGILNPTNSVFYGCDSVKQITIGDTVTRINPNIFSYCSGVTEIVIPNSVTMIGISAFYGCTSLVSVTISESVKTIGMGAFMKCSSLRNIVIPDGVETILNAAFRYCSNLINAHIPASVTEIGPVILADTPAYICSDTNDCYAHTYADENNIEFRLCDGHKTLDDPVSVHSVFCDESIAAIGWPVCYTVKTGTSATRLRMTGDETKEEKTINNYFTYYEKKETEFAVWSDSSLYTDVNGERIWTVYHTFTEYGDSEYDSHTFKFQAGNENGFTGAKRSIKQFIIPSFYGFCGKNGGDNLLWVLHAKEKTLSITGSGEMENYSVTTPAPWISFLDRINSIEIGKNVQTIGDYAFNARFNGNVSFELPSSLLSVGEQSFTGVSTTILELPNGIQTFSTNAFLGFGRYLYIPDSVNSILDCNFSTPIICSNKWYTSHKDYYSDYFLRFIPLQTNDALFVFDGNMGYQYECSQIDEYGYHEMQSLQYSIGTNLSLPENQYSVPFHSFAGWLDTLNGAVYQDQQSLKGLSLESGVHVLQALWKPNTYSAPDLLNLNNDTYSFANGCRDFWG